MKSRIDGNWLLLTAIAALPVLAADGLAVKTGTWETTLTSKTAGMAMPAEAMASMTPQQKAQMEAMMKQMGGGAPRTTTMKSCVTEKDLREGAFAQQQKDSNCTYKPVVATGKRQEMTFACPGKEGLSSGHLVVDATDSSNVKGEMHITVAGGATVDSTFTSKWLSASCAETDK